MLDGGTCSGGGGSARKAWCSVATGTLIYYGGYGAGAGWLRGRARIISRRPEAARTIMTRPGSRPASAIILPVPATPFQPPWKLMPMTEPMAQISTPVVSGIAPTTAKATTSLALGVMEAAGATDSPWHSSARPANLEIILGQVQPEVSGGSGWPGTRRGGSWGRRRRRAGR